MTPLCRNGNSGPMMDMSCNLHCCILTARGAPMSPTLCTLHLSIRFGKGCIKYCVLPFVFQIVVGITVSWPTQSLYNCKVKYFCVGCWYATAAIVHVLVRPLRWWVMNGGNGVAYALL
eukprot:PhF_6_TR39994/c0_g1_i2/m.59361